MSGQAEKSLPEYALAFTSKLGDLVATALQLPGGPPMGVLKASALYHSELQATAAAVGHEMKIPEEAAIAFFVLGEAVRCETETGSIRKRLPGEAREKFLEHQTIVNRVLGVLDIYDGTNTASEFLKRMAGRLA